MDLPYNLRRGMTCTAVRHVKDTLVQLGYLHAATHDTFGTETLGAVIAFQLKNGLEADGIVGPLTWAALSTIQPGTPSFGSEPETVSDDGIPPNIGAAARKLILADLSGASEIRRSIVLDALQFAYDPAAPRQYPLSFYIRGGNLYNKTDQTTLNVMTMRRLNSYFSNGNYAAYYSDGRKEMMLAASEAAGYTIPGADCSGGVVGLLHHAKVVKRGMDANANSLGGNGYSTPTTATLLAPADLVHKSGHIGMYVGGGYAVEWMGGAYGCQLTKLHDRRGYNFISRRLTKMGAWTGYRKPKMYC